MALLIEVETLLR